MEKEYKLPRILSETLIYLIRENSWKTTSEILKYLLNSFSKKGIPINPESDRKILLKSLNIMEELELIEKKEGKGRKPAQWRIKGRVFKDRNFYMSEEELYHYLVFFSFIPKEYRELSIYKPVLRVIERLSQNIEPDTLKLIEKSFLYEPTFSTRFSKPNSLLLEKVIEAIINRNPITVIKDGELRDLWPINLFFYEGNLYLGALKVIKKGNLWEFPFRSYLISNLELAPNRKREIKKPPDSLFEENRGKRIFYPDKEKPFLFGVKLNKRYSKEIEKGGKAFTTQFFVDGKSGIVYLVGYTHPIFYKDFISKEILEIIPPSQEIIDIAVQNRLKEKLKEEFPHLPKVSYNLSENLENFKVFREELQNFLLKRIQILSCENTFFSKKEKLICKRNLGESMEKILKFRGKYSFLSNFYPCEVEYEGLTYPSVENAYQAAKTNPYRRKKFLHLSPKEARKLGRKVPIFPDWSSKRVRVMAELVWKKFSRNPELKEKLLSTKDAILIEGNTWGDEFWGVNLRVKDNNSKFGYRGKNILGRILMCVRKLLRYPDISDNEAVTKILECIKNEI